LGFSQSQTQGQDRFNRYSQSPRGRTVGAVSVLSPRNRRRIPAPILSGDGRPHEWRLSTGYGLAGGRQNRGAAADAKFGDGEGESAGITGGRIRYESLQRGREHFVRLRPGGADEPSAASQRRQSFRQLAAVARRTDHVAKDYEHAR